MNETAHNEVIEALAELRQALPSMRLGQLIANLATVARGAVAGAVWEVEDDELLQAIRWQLQQLAPCSAAGSAESDAAPDRSGLASFPVSTTNPQQGVG
jgi:hypothetical protein